MMEISRTVSSYMYVVGVLITFFGLSSNVFADPVTRLSSIARLDALKKYHHVAGFKIGGIYDFENPSAYELGGEGGTTFESLGVEPLRLAYIDVGTPKRNSHGQITNAVIINPYYSGDATNMYHFWYFGQPGNDFCQGSLVGPGKLIDTNKYYVVFLDALGLWGASKPSDGLGTNFPSYTVLDTVQANYRLLRDRLRVAKVKLATGVSMGAFQTYAWGILHPEYVEAIMPIGGATERSPVLGWLFQLMTAAMKSDPVWRETRGDYYHLPKCQRPNQGMMFGWSLIRQSILSFDYRNAQPWRKVEKEIFHWQPEGDQGAQLFEYAADYDINDLIYRNDAIRTFSLTDELGRIRAKTLILHVANDQWMSLAEAEHTAKAIEGARLVAFNSPLAHYGVFRAPNVLKEEVSAFLVGSGVK